MIVLKSEAEIAKMRDAGRIVAQVLATVAESLRPGITTRALDSVARRVLEQHHAESPFWNYPNPHDPSRPFPGVICTSVNEELVHGVPGERRLEIGDIISVDCGARYRGWIADGAWTFAVGEVDTTTQRLLAVTQDALYKTIDAMQEGAMTGDLGAITQQVVELAGFQVTRAYTSHGVGRNLHEDPRVPNYGTVGQGIPLRNGMTLAIEPMVLTGTSATRVAADGWTVVATDGKMTAHFEHTVAVTPTGPQILTSL